MLYAAYAWALIGLAAPVIWTTVVLLPGRAWRWRFVRRVLRVLFPALGMPITVRGLEFIRTCPVCLYAGSLVPQAIVSKAPRICFGRNPRPFNRTISRIIRRSWYE